MRDVWIYIMKSGHYSLMSDYPYEAQGTVLIFIQEKLGYLAISYYPLVLTDTTTVNR